MCQIVDIPQGIEIIKDQNFFAAGFYLSTNNDTCLLVKDYDQNRASSVANKIPGGVSQTYVYYDQIFYSVVEELLNKYFFEGQVVNMILSFLKQNPLSCIEMGMIVEFLEETGCFPVLYETTIVHQEIHNKNDKNKKFHQFFFWVKKLLTNNSKDFEDFKEPVQDEVFDSVETAVRGRYLCPVKDVMQEVFFNHRNPLRTLFQHKAVDKTFCEKYYFLL